MSDSEDADVDVRRAIVCSREEWDLMDPYLREHYRWLIRTAPRCFAHGHSEPCPTCRSYIAAGL